MTADVLPSGPGLLPRPHRVHRVGRETPDTCTLDLKPVDGAPLDPFAPGQFNMVYVLGVGEAAISISGDPGRGDVVTHTLREVGGVTEALGRLTSGDFVGVRGPFGRGWPMEEAEGRDVVIVAGGIGFAPMRAAIYELLSKRDRYGRIGLAHGARTPGDVLFQAELEQWSRGGWMDVAVTVDRAAESWSGHVGIVTTTLRYLSFDPSETIAFLCGPEIMIRFAAAELVERGVPESSVYVALERNMKCGVGLCGHCQIGPVLLCRDGPVLPLDVAGPWLRVEEI